LNNHDPYLKSIADTLNGKPIWGLAFTGNYAFIGTRFHGLYIFNLLNKELSKRYDTTEVGMIRRLKNINDTIFIASQKAAFYLVKKNSNWSLTRIKSNIQKGFYTDFVKWGTKTYATFYGYEHNQHICYLKNDSLINSEFSPVKLDSNYSFLSAAANDNFLTFGGAVSYQIQNKVTTKIDFRLNLDKKNQKLYPVWDIAIIDDRIFMAMGNPDNNKMGMIYEHGLSDLKDMNKSFYAQTLCYDKKRKGMWIGTLNNGIYFHPFINSSYHVSCGLTEEYKIKSIPNNNILVYNDQKVLVSDFTNNTFSDFFIKGSSFQYRYIYDVDRWHDTTAILTNQSLILLNNKRDVLYKFKYNPDIESFSSIYKKDKFVNIFSKYLDTVIQINLINKSVRKFSSNSNSISSTTYNGNLFYYSKFTGFHYFDTVAHNFNVVFPVIEGYTIQKDTLWVLNAGVIKSYKIELKRFSLTPVTTINISSQIPDFLPTWIIQCKGRIYTGNNMGFIKITSNASDFDSYTYTGNYSEGSPPVTNNQFIYFNYSNYITKIDPDSLPLFGTISNFNIRIKPDKNIYQNTPFTIYFEADDYFVQNHSLKQIILLTSDGKEIEKRYSVDDHIEFSTGLEKGDYIMNINVNGVNVARKEISISIPWSSNPIFYIAITLFIILFLIILFSSIVSRRNYEKRILESRLESLKQTLNPHFVFNSLNLIYSLVLERKIDTAIKTINNFSDLHRYYLENSNKPTMTLDEELSFIDTYLKLQSKRFESDDPIEYYISNHKDKKIMATILPTMFLQPIIENAVKYSGIDSSVSSSRSIWIDIEKVDSILVIGIENTLGESINENFKGSKLGLILVKERIEIFNKTYHKNISMVEYRPLVHCKRGYRIEIVYPKAVI